MSLLETAETTYDPDGTLAIRGTRGALLCNARYPVSDGSIIPTSETDEPAAVAYVNQGRWVAVCPFGCGSAQVLSEEDHYWYCCGPSGCQNWSVGNALVPVTWPDPETRAAIENLLAPRPKMFRNWLTWETTDQLAAENIANGPVSA